MLEKAGFENYRCFKKSSIYFKNTAIIVAAEHGDKAAGF